MMISHRTLAAFGRTLSVSIGKRLVLVSLVLCGTAVWTQAAIPEIQKLGTATIRSREDFNLIAVSDSICAGEGVGATSAHEIRLRAKDRAVTVDYVDFQLGETPDWSRVPLFQTLTPGVHSAWITLPFANACPRSIRVVGASTGMPLSTWGKLDVEHRYRAVSKVTRPQ